MRSEKAAIPPRLLASYIGTAYEAGGVTVRVGRRSAGMDRLLTALGARRGGFVSASNPLSRLRPPGWNARMQLALAAAVRRLRSVPGRGSENREGGSEYGGGRWSEAHLLIAADPRRLLPLARRFRQRGIVVVARGQNARLLLLSR